MKSIFKPALWCATLMALTFVFYRFGATEAEALYDEATALTLLTDAGPVSTTMAEYLPGAVAAEMPAAFGQEALKAQAVAVRSYVMATHRHENADVCANSGCCLAYMDRDELMDFWGGDYEANMALVRQAVRETDGQYLSYGGQAIQAVFHASSAGATESSASIWSAQPYLISVSSPETADTVPGLISTASFTPDELAARLSLDPGGAPDTWLGDAVLDAAGRVQTLALCGQAFEGKALRSALGLRSTAFTAVWDGTRFVFSVAGHGHGVGMSQYGAKLLAAQGWSYGEILAHYYPGTELVTPQQ